MTNNSVKEPNNVDAHSVDAFLAQAEKMLDGTIQLGIAADAKAISLLSAFSAVGIAIGGAGATMYVANAVTFHKIIVACGVSAVGTLVSVLCFARAAIPDDFHVAGHEPRLMAESAGDRTLMLRYVADSLQRRITSNRKSLKTSGAWTKRGLGFIGLSILFGVMAYMAA